jgi:hypothetical protein
VIPCLAKGEWHNRGMPREALEALLARNRPAEIDAA